MRKLNTIPVFYLIFITCFILNHKIYSQVIQSDDFNSATLNTSVWSFINPLSDGSYAMTGYNSGNASIDISVPAGTEHDVWITGITVPRIMQPAADTDFEIEVKFESIVSVTYQQQGIIIEQEPGHVLRYEIYSENSIVKMYGTVIDIPGGVLNPPLYVNRNVGTQSPPYYLRVKRVGDDWFLTYSFDRITWLNALISGASFNYPMNVTSVGVYAGNSVSTSHTAVVDYFFNTDNPIIPEDSEIPKITITPINQTIYNNSPVNFQINVEGITGLFASTVTLEFDETLYKYLGITNGSFLESNVSAYNVLYKSLPGGNSYTDSVTIDQVILGRDDVDGTGVIFNLSLLPLRSGNGKIKVRSFSLRDINNNIIDANIDSAVVTINSPAPNIKVLLEGPYQTGAMTSLLPELGYLPLTQPFNTAPWNYVGFEKVDPNFYTAHPEIVDWVFVELRTGTAENTTIGQRAAFLNENGYLVDIDGVSQVSFFVPSTAQYYVVIRHRNHLDIMSSSPVDVNFTSSLFDFTSIGTNAYGTNAMKEVDTGIFAMYVGDGNNDGIINGTDFNVYSPLFRSGGAGYLGVDWNLDGIINGSDFNKFNPNFRTGQQSQVP